MTVPLGYLSLLSGNVGYTYGTSLWDTKDAEIPTWKAFRGATYMRLGMYSTERGHRSKHCAPQRPSDRSSCRSTDHRVSCLQRGSQKIRCVALMDSVTEFTHLLDDLVPGHTKVHTGRI